VLTGSHRRRRAAALLVAFLAAGISLLGMHVAEGQASQQQPNCGGFAQPKCATTSTFDDTSTTIEDDVTTTTEDDSGDDSGDEDDDETPTTERQTPTTERVTTTTFAVTTSLDVLVPGDGTAGAESTTTTEKGSAVEGDSGLSDNQLVALIVGGSTALAAAVALLTWRYWRATQPVEIAVEPVSPERGSGGGSGGRTQRSVFLD
jgi:hypothetical protein